MQLENRNPAPRHEGEKKEIMPLTKKAAERKRAVDVKSKEFHCWL